jgi:hypothetical protein
VIDIKPVLDGQRGCGRYRRVSSSDLLYAISNIERLPLSGPRAIAEVKGLWLSGPLDYASAILGCSGRFWNKSAFRINEVNEFSVHCAAANRGAPG